MCVYLRNIRKRTGTFFFVELLSFLKSSSSILKNEVIINAKEVGGTGQLYDNQFNGKKKKNQEEKEKILDIIVIREMEVRGTHFPPIKSKNSQFWSGCRDTINPINCWWHVNDSSLFGKQSISSY